MSKRVVHFAQTATFIHRWLMRDFNRFPYAVLPLATRPATYLPVAELYRSLTEQIPLKPIHGVFFNLPSERVMDGFVTEYCQWGVPSSVSTVFKNRDVVQRRFDKPVITLGKGQDLLQYLMGEQGEIIHWYDDHENKNRLVVKTGNKRVFLPHIPRNQLIVDSRWEGDDLMLQTIDNIDNAPSCFGKSVALHLLLLKLSNGRYCYERDVASIPYDDLILKNGFLKADKMERVMHGKRLGFEGKPLGIFKNMKIWSLKGRDILSNQTQFLCSLALPLDWKWDDSKTQKAIIGELQSHEKFSFHINRWVGKE